MIRMIGVFILSAGLAQGVIFYGTDDASYHREVAPDGALAGSGWQYQGEFGGVLGTMISPSHFITAKHVGVATTFISKSYFNGVADITHMVDTTVNGGLGYWNITGTDLRVFQVEETFASYAEMYAGTDEVGKGLVVMGRGTQRGTTVELSGVAKGWYWGTSDHAARWGVNEVNEAITVGSAEYLRSEFSADAGPDESHLSGGDSGGAVFIQEGGVWKLAGINYAVDGKWDFDGLPGTDEFDAALYDAGGLYNGSDGAGWTLVPDGDDDVPSSFYSTRISSYRDEILEITSVPEPGGLVLFLVSGSLVFFRRRSGGR